MRDPRFEQFVRAQSGALLRLAYLLTRRHGDAEDLVQEVLLAALRKWDVVSAADKPEAYVRRMLVNNHISSHRRLSSREIPLDRPTTLVNPNLQWNGAFHPGQIDPRGDQLLCGGPCTHGVAGQPSHVTMTTAVVRYDCPGACGDWADRVVTMINFPQEHAHVTVLSPPGESITWLTDYIYVDPPR